jgi:hypothetical protein
MPSEPALIDAPTTATEASLEHPLEARSRVPLAGFGAHFVRTARSFFA